MPSNSSWHGEGPCPPSPEASTVHSLPGLQPSPPEAAPWVALYPTLASFIHSFTYSKLSPKHQPPYQALLTWWWGCQILVP